MRGSLARILLLLSVSMLLSVLVGTALPLCAHASDAMTPETLLENAFVNQYDVATTATIELVVKNERGQERRRLLETASKLIDDRQHSIGRLIAPEYLRGMTILQIEARDRGHDAFVYMPAAHGVRRVSTAQRGDSLFGTDVTYEDLERRRVEDYRVVSVAPDTAQEEAVLAILAEPRTARSFHTVRFDVARADGVLLQTAYFKRGAQAPFREITAARGGMRRQGGHTLPTRLLVENHDRGTTTNVFYRGLEIAATIDDRLFSVRTLEQKGRIPGAPHAPERPTDPSSR